MISNTHKNQYYKTKNIFQYDKVVTDVIYNFYIENCRSSQDK